jgi:hypothetical protein
MVSDQVPSLRNVRIVPNEVILLCVLVILSPLFIESHGSVRGHPSDDVRSNPYFHPGVTTFMDAIAFILSSYLKFGEALRF